MWKLIAGGVEGQVVMYGMAFCKEPGGHCGETRSNWRAVLADKRCDRRIRSCLQSPFGSAIHNSIIY
jgi:hypothetical protein